MLKHILNTFANCFKIPELKSRIMFTLIVLALCRLLSMVTAPGLDGVKLHAHFQKLEQNAARDTAGGGGGLLGMYSMFTGGALERCAIGTLGIMPYISASIIIQLLSAVLPGLSKLMREEGGRVKIIQYGRYLTVLLCILWGAATAVSWENPAQMFNGNFDGKLVLVENIWWYRIQTILVLTTGTMLLMWLGEQITERGVGNGISLIISIGILARLPQTWTGIMDMFFRTSGEGERAQFNLFYAVFLLILLVAVVASVIALTQTQRKIPVQYAQRAVGRKVVAGGSSFLPLRLNFAGVMPIIFAQAILMLPQRLFMTLGERFNSSALKDLAIYLREDAFLYIVLYAIMVLFFSYFWTATQFNEIQIADDLKKNGGYIPGVRPGTATSDFLHKVMSRVTLAGAVFLISVAVLPILLNRQMQIPYPVATFFGGTSILILVGVMLDTMRAMQSYLMMRHYDGFLKKGKLRGRF